jgi:hypothetical protein
MKNDNTLEQKTLSPIILQSFIRPAINYLNQTDKALLVAYKSGVYDATVSFLGESHLKITGISQTIEEVKKFLRQSSFNSELTLEENKGTSIRTPIDQEQLADNWLKENGDNPYYTHIILMIPRDNERKKLSNIVRDFLQRRFKNTNYAFVEHTDTNIFHYHVIVNEAFNDNALSKLQSDFISACIEYGAKVL